MVTLEQQIACVARELKRRRKIYPTWIEKKKVNENAANQEIAAMEAILNTLTDLAIHKSSSPRTEGRE